MNEKKQTNFAVLISAYACEPGRGSEPGVGWNIVRELSSRCELTVITRANNEEIIRSSKEGWVSRVNWEFVDPSDWVVFFKKRGLGTILFYWFWQRSMLRRAKEILNYKKVDLVHHLTFGNYLPATLLARLDRPLVIGPVGGGEKKPMGLTPQLSTLETVQEWVKRGAKSFLRSLPSTRRVYGKCELAIAATKDTAGVLRDLGAKNVEVLPQSGCGKDEVSAYLENHFDKSIKQGRELRIVVACRLIPWKAVDLAVEAVALAKERGLLVRLKILNDGTARKELEKLVQRLDLATEVEFTGFLPSLNHVYAEIRDSDVVIHPALNEAFGQSCLESLVLGRPVICLDWAGPGGIITSDCGIKVLPLDRSSTVLALADAIERAFEWKIPQSLIEENCILRAREFQWENNAEQIFGFYQSVIKT